MSRIGKQVIMIPAKTELSVASGRIMVKGPLGEISRALHPSIALKINGAEVTLEPKVLTLESRALWGTYAAHVKNMLSGVTTPFQKKLILEGIGYKSEVKGEEIIFALGFSHPVKVTIPKGLKVTAEKNLITIAGVDKEVVGEFAAKLRDLKKPEPYKGKGMRYEDEVIKRKQGKKTV